MDQTFYSYACYMVLGDRFGDQLGLLMVYGLWWLEVAGGIV